MMKSRGINLAVAEMLAAIGITAATSTRAISLSALPSAAVIGNGQKRRSAHGSGVAAASRSATKRRNVARNRRAHRAHR